MMSLETGSIVLNVKVQTSCQEFLNTLLFDH